MKKIVALSDTHLEDEEPPRELIELAKDADIILHAGDFVSKKFYAALEELGRLEAVWGNADHPELRRLLPQRKTIKVEGICIGLVHMASHISSLIGAEMMAKEMGVDVLVFGHLHRPLVETEGKLLICPGSPTVPRMSAPSVAILEIEDGSVLIRFMTFGSPTCDYFKLIQSLAEKSK